MLISIAVLIVAYESHNAFYPDDPLARSGKASLSTGSYWLRPTYHHSAANFTTKKSLIASPKEGKPGLPKGYGGWKARYDEANQNADYRDS